MKKKIGYVVLLVVGVFAVLAYINRDQIKKGWEDGTKAAMERQKSKELQSK